MTEIRKVSGYMTVFVAGFAACAVVLHMTVRPADGHRSVSSGFIRNISNANNILTPVNNLPSIADAAAKIEPAVVNIDITGVRRARHGALSFLQPDAPQQFEGSGSGIILSADGYIITNNHVVEPVAQRDSGVITVRLDSGKEFRDVSIVGRDPATDLAVLKVHGAKNLPAADLGDSDSLRVGDWAIAVGNPLGFNSTVTLGIISALNRAYSRSDTSALDRVIQTDAAINPGNSGGALADINGRIIGINTAIASQTGGSVGIGFAIPINAARRIIEQLVQKGKVTRPYLGVVYSPISGVEKDALPDGVQLPEDGQGAVVINERGAGPAVVPDSPAAKAGLREFDVIRSVDGKSVEDIRDVKDTVLQHNVGDRIPLHVWRNGNEFDIIVPLDTMPEDYTRRSRRHVLSPEEMMDPETNLEVQP